MLLYMQYSVQEARSAPVPAVMSLSSGICLSLGLWLRKPRSFVPLWSGGTPLLFHEISPHSWWHQKISRPLFLSVTCTLVLCFPSQAPHHLLVFCFSKSSQSSASDRVLYSSVTYTKVILSVLSDNSNLLQAHTHTKSDQSEVQWY